MTPRLVLAVGLMALIGFIFAIAAWTVADRLFQPLQNDRDEFAEGLGFNATDTHGSVM